jgi:hypothetical protein
LFPCGHAHSIAGNRNSSKLWPRGARSCSRKTKSWKKFR